LTDDFSGTADLGSALEATWAVINDPAAIGRILPNAESVASDGAGGLNIVVAVKQFLMTVRVDLHATWHDVEPLHHLRLQLDGRPRGLGGALHLSVPVDLEPIASGTRVGYRGVLELEGSVASFRRQLEEILREQVASLVRAVEREANRG
jgi:carbon monoxide dehydrogenase subunit G